MAVPFFLSLLYLHWIHVIYFHTSVCFLVVLFCTWQFTFEFLFANKNNNKPKNRTERILYYVVPRSYDFLTNITSHRFGCVCVGKSSIQIRNGKNIHASVWTNFFVASRCLYAWYTIFIITMKMFLLL